MLSVDLDKLLAGLPTTWSVFLTDWDRSLRAANYPATTRYNYLLAAVQLARYLASSAGPATVVTGSTASPRLDVDGSAAEQASRDATCASQDPTAVGRHQIEAFQVWMLQTRSAATALNKHKALQQFFKWLCDDEEEIDQSPMLRVRQPKVPCRLIPIIGDEDTKKVLGTCKGKDFIQVRDEAIIRILYNTGARLSEVANLELTDVDLSLDVVLYHGKGSKDRRVRLGPKTARAISRYLRTRGSHPGFGLPQLWLAARGARPLAANGIKLMLKRRGLRAGVAHVHAHRWRHNYAHEWKLAGGDSGDLMLVLGWTSDDMPRHYGASAAAQRAQQVQARMGIGERV